MCSFLSRWWDYLFGIDDEDEVEAGNRPVVLPPVPMQEGWVRPFRPLEDPVAMNSPNLSANVDLATAMEQYNATRAPVDYDAGVVVVPFFPEPPVDPLYPGTTAPYDYTPQSDPVYDPGMPIVSPDPGYDPGMQTSDPAPSYDPGMQTSDPSPSYDPGPSTDNSSW